MFRILLKQVFKNILAKFKEKQEQILEKQLRILKSLGRRQHEDFQEISEKLWCFFPNILYKILDNLMKYCAQNIENGKKFESQRNNLRNSMLEKIRQFKKI